MASSWSLSVCGATLGCGPRAGQAPLGFGVVARWPMDAATQAVMLDASGAGRHGSVGSAVVAEEGTYRFPGWSGNVDAAGRLHGAVPASAGSVEVLDPADALDPRTGTFIVSLRLRSALTAAGRLPSAPAASFNVVQKARADDPGGFWKIELLGDGGAAGRLHWVLSDGRTTVETTSVQRVDDGGWHTVTAARRGHTVVLTVDGVPVLATATGLGDVHPRGPFSATMTIGKKPGSTDPGDAFAGWIDELVVSV